MILPCRSRYGRIIKMSKRAEQAIFNHMLMMNDDWLPDADQQFILDYLTDPDDLVRWQAAQRDEANSDVINRLTDYTKDGDILHTLSCLAWVFKDGVKEWADDLKDNDILEFEADFSIVNWAWVEKILRERFADLHKRFETHHCHNCDNDMWDDDFQAGKMCCDKPRFEGETDERCPGCDRPFDACSSIEIAHRGDEEKTWCMRCWQDADDEREDGWVGEDDDDDSDGTDVERCPGCHEPTHFCTIRIAIRGHNREEEKVWCVYCWERHEDEERAKGWTEMGDDEKRFNEKWPDASCHRCEKPVRGETVVFCGGGGGECETWYCRRCHEAGTHDCPVCAVMNSKPDVPHPDGCDCGNGCEEEQDEEDATQEVIDALGNYICSNKDKEHLASCLEWVFEDGVELWTLDLSNNDVIKFTTDFTVVNWKGVEVALQEAFEDEWKEINK